MAGIIAAGMYGIRSRRPGVVIELEPDEGPPATVTVDCRDAIDAALSIINAANAAIADAVAIAAMGGERLTTEECAAILGMLREERARIERIEIPTLAGDWTEVHPAPSDDPPLEEPGDPKVRG